MPNLPQLTAICALTVIATSVCAKDIGPDQALKLRDAGTIQSFEKLNAAALSKHPGGAVGDTELEQKYGKYIYGLELLDAQGVKWELELDAVTGEILGNHQDT